MATPDSPFTITPEKRASQLHFLYRQLFVTPPALSRRAVDLTGKTAIITGANGGLGFETARHLLDLGASVILAVRDVAKGEAAKLDLARGRDVASTSVEVWNLDLASYSSIQAFAEKAKGLPNLDIAVLNAGVFKVREEFAEGGYEEGVQINFLSNMLLTLLLLPIMKEKRRSGSEPGRICVVNSDTAAWSSLTPRTATSPIMGGFKTKAEKWDCGDRYGTTKLLGQLFLSELCKRVRNEDVVVNFANPGFCGGSELGRETSGVFRVAYKIQCALLSRTCAVGARTLVHAVATLGAGGHGQYIEDAKV